MTDRHQNEDYTSPLPELQELPTSIEPQTDLWPGTLQRIEGRTRRAARRGPVSQSPRGC